ncbi:RluA family pseudouridine synthase [Candidatus Parcubacteria bacterium]|nr:RluA family pseudouridine synthase [Candidatus Parcubacteria bacterium]
MEPTVIFEDDSIVVLNKPAGLQVIPDRHAERETVEGWLKNNYPQFFIVHRIDRETSGLLVVAKTEDAFTFLKEQFKSREVQKTYRAFVYGAFKDERGIVDKPIGSARGGLGPRSAKLPYGTTRDAVTVYRRIQNGEDFAYVEVFPKTGRTHQIRVHFAAIQHPIVADTMYAPGRTSLLGFERLALHALSLTFTHPKGKKVTFEAPLPPDFVAAERELREG